MKVRYFEDTDTLYIELSERAPVQTEELNENVLIELDNDGNGVASKKAEIDVSTRNESQQRIGQLCHSRPGVHVRQARRKASSPSAQAPVFDGFHNGASSVTHAIIRQAPVCSLHSVDRPMSKAGHCAGTAFIARDN